MKSARKIDMHIVMTIATRLRTMRRIVVSSGNLVQRLGIVVLPVSSICVGSSSPLAFLWAGGSSTVGELMGC